MKVRSLKNDKALQVVVHDDEGNLFFQSYNSVIVKVDKYGKIFLDRRLWQASSTTGKYRNMFLGERIAETRKKIKRGQYVLKDLNN